MTKAKQTAEQVRARAAKMAAQAARLHMIADAMDVAKAADARFFEANRAFLASNDEPGSPNPARDLMFAANRASLNAKEFVRKLKKISK